MTETKAEETLLALFMVNVCQSSILFPSRSKKLLGAPGHTTRSKDATRGSWHRY